MATKKTASAAEKGAVKKAARKSSPSRKQSAKKQPAPTHSHMASSPDDYTDPALRDRIKEQVLAGDKGGRAGQWSARKAQMVAHEYAAEGGGYKHDRNATQQSLKDWGDEKWHTASGEPAIQGEVTHRYLPDEAWKELSPDEKKATDAKKVRGSKQGKQFVPNTTKASRARQHATKDA